MKSYTNEVSKSFVVFTAVETGRSTDVALEESNGRSVSDRISINDVQVVITFNLQHETNPENYKNTLANLTSGKSFLASQERRFQ